MKQLHLTTILAAVALCFTACSSDDSFDGALSSSSNKVAAVVTASIDDGQASSRVTNDGESATFDVGDEINVVADGAIYVYEKTQKTDAGAGTTETWSSDAPYYFQDESTITFQGWYSTLTPSSNSIAITTSDQTIAETSGYNSCDILVTPTVTASVTSPSVSFTNSNAFAHIMSKVTFVFSLGESMTADYITALTGLDLTVPVDQATFNTLTCVLTPTASTEGTISKSSISVTENSTTYTSDPIILIPQTLAKDACTLGVTYSSADYTATFPSSELELKAGYHYTFNVTLNGTALEVKLAEIADWTAWSPTNDSDDDVSASMSSGE